MTIGEFYFDFTKKLKTMYEDREAENISDWVFENVAGLKRWQRRQDQNEKLDKPHFEKLKKLSLEDLGEFFSRDRGSKF